MSEATSAMQAARRPFRNYDARHVDFSASADGRVATIRLNRPERKNPLTFESYAELRDLFRDLVYAADVRTLVLIGSGGNFCSRSVEITSTGEGQKPRVVSHTSGACGTSSATPTPSLDAAPAASPGRGRLVDTSYHPAGRGSSGNGPA